MYPERFIFHQIGKQFYTHWLPAYDINPTVPQGIRRGTLKSCRPLSVISNLRLWRPGLLLLPQGCCTKLFLALWSIFRYAEGLQSARLRSKDTAATMQKKSLEMFKPYLNFDFSKELDKLNLYYERSYYPFLHDNDDGINFQTPGCNQNMSFRVQEENNALHQP